MTLYETIFRRRSCRSFTGVPVDSELIERIMSFDMVPLYPDIKVRWDIVPRNQVKCICPWTTPQVITIYSEEQPGWLENVGFLFQQMDLYLQSIGLGVCWLGLGKLNAKTAPEVPGMKFAIMLAFGHPKGDMLRDSAADFHRKDPAQIADRADIRLEPARLAPSSVNSQPWYFTHEGNVIHAYCTKASIIPDMNRIDMGIALAHMYVAEPETFRFFRAEKPPTVSGHTYIGSFE